MRGAPFVVVPCSGAKAPGPSLPAVERYTGGLHRLAMQAARTLTSDDRIRVASARYGLLELHQLTEPYDQRIDGLAADDLFALKSRIHVDGIRMDHEDPTAEVIALVPAAYVDAMSWSPMLARKLVTPLAGVAGVGEMRGRLAGLRDGRLTVDDLTATEYQCNQPATPTKRGTPEMTNPESTINVAGLAGLTLKQLQAVARANGVPFSRVKQADLIAALTRKANGEAPAPKAEATPIPKGSAVHQLEKAGVPKTAATRPVGSQAGQKAADGPKKATGTGKATGPGKAAEAATEKVLHDECEVCGFKFSKPRARARCSSESACSARKAGEPTRGSKGGGKAASAKEAKAEAARQSEEQRQAAGREHKAVQAWEKAGSKGKRPATPNLDALHAEAERKAS